MKMAVVLVLLFFTSYLYHLPQAVLAVIVMMAVFSLIRIKPLTQAWKVDRVSAVIGVVTFVATLLMAPSIANGILLGIALTVLYFLVRTMRPRADIVARKPDGTLGGILDLEELRLLEAELTGHDIRGEGFDHDVEIAHRAVVVAPRILDMVLDIR